MKHRILTGISTAILMSLGLALAPVPTALGQEATPAAPQTAPDATAKLSGPVREVAKLATSGMDENVVKAYIANSPHTFNLTMDDLLQLRSMGVSSSIMTAMLTHDYTYGNNPPVNPSTTPPPEVAPPQPQYPTSQPTTQTPPDNGTDTTAPGTSVPVYTQPAADGSWYYGGDYGWYWLPGPYDFVWGAYGWCWFPNRGWCWFPRGGFHGRGGFGIGRFDGRGFRGGEPFRRSGFANGGGIHTFGGGRSFGGHPGGNSGHAGGGFSGGHSGGGFSGGHMGGGFGGGHR